MRAILLFLFATASLAAAAQSNFKEGGNAFAHYTKTGEVKHLATAKKHIDAIYKTRRDSSNVRVNILRAMMYSAMAYSDSARSIKNDLDPIDIAYAALRRIPSRDLMQHPAQVRYVKQNLAYAHIFKAKKALEKQAYEEAYGHYLQVRDLAQGNYNVDYNLAVLAGETGKYEESVRYYDRLLNRGDAPPSHYLELAEIHRKKGDRTAVLQTLQEAKRKFPKDRDVLMNLIQEYAQMDDQRAIAAIVDQAIKFEPENAQLSYLAGYAKENTGDIAAARKHYRRVLELDGNNYEANLALGLIYLDDFLKDADNAEARHEAHDLLLKANEIRPYEVNALKSLELYYEKDGDPAQLDRVRLLLNRIRG